jgi:hypothetical protein
MHAMGTSADQMAITDLEANTWLAYGAPRADRFQSLPLGAVTPTGWLREQLLVNMGSFTGHLDQLVPDLITHDEIYGRDRLTPAVRSKDVGARGIALHDRAQLLWWNSETQSNWWDGYVRAAVLLQDPAALARATAHVAALLATQDADGYLGIYDEDLRYHVTGENGELWAKATCARYLLGWYEYTQDRAVLTAVTRAVDELMRRYPIGCSHPFRTDRAETCGLTHGLAMTDVLESLHRITRDRRYADYLVFLYADFSAQPLAEDGRVSTLLDEARPLHGHGVHTYQQLRSVAAAYQATGHPQLGNALVAFRRKIRECLTPSGGPVGDEFINGTGADATSRGYEYCSLQELLHSYASLLIKDGERDVADAVEWLFLNAAQGARHPDGMGIAYLKSDNSFAMTGPLNGDPSQPEQTRYRYSPVHREAAVCCVPNAGRIAPYYVQHMWMRDGDALVAALLGPSIVDADVSGARVRIEVATTYPADGIFVFTITGARRGLVLKVRRPAWTARCIASEPYSEQAGFLCFDISASDDPVVLRIETTSELRQHVDRDGAVYFSHGALVLAHALPARESVVKHHAIPGFFDRTYEPIAETRYQYPTNAIVTPKGDVPQRWRVALANAATGQCETVTLEPMATTILRQVTFPPMPGVFPPPSSPSCSSLSER